jgi:hypothetical protein
MTYTLPSVRRGSIGLCIAAFSIFSLGANAATPTPAEAPLANKPALLRAPVAVTPAPAPVNVQTLDNGFVLAISGDSVEIGVPTWCEEDCRTALMKAMAGQGLHASMSAKGQLINGNANARARMIGMSGIISTTMGGGSKCNAVCVGKLAKSPKKKA